MQFSAQIFTAEVLELWKIELLDCKTIQVRAAATWSEIEHFLTENVETNPASSAILDRLKWFASTQIRNVACIGGNVATASPISDMNHVLQSLGATLKIMRWDFGMNRIRERIARMDTFFKSYRKIDFADDEVIVCVQIPLCQKDEFAKSYKQSQRLEDDIAIVSSGMRMKLNFDREEKLHIIEDICLSFGGMAEKTIIASNTCQFLRGKAFNMKLFKETCNILQEELCLPEQPVGDKREYRLTLTTSVMFKFFVHVGISTDSSDFVGLEELINPFNRGISHGTQTFPFPPESKSKLHQPARHSTAYEPASGDAVYVDDIPRSKGELVGALVMTIKPFAKIVRIDWSPAEAVDGVQVFHADHFMGHNTIGEIIQDEELFATKYSYYVGQPVGIVVAQNQSIAEQAARQVIIEYYEELNPIMSIEDAISQNSFLSQEFQIVTGDIDAGFVSSDNIFEGVMRIGCTTAFLS